MCQPDLRDDSGYATVAAAGVIVALATVVMAIVVGASLLIAHHRAQTAADLGAVAGAYAAYYGQDGCAQATLIVEANQATVVSCTVTPAARAGLGAAVNANLGLEDVEVTATVGSPRGVFGALAATRFRTATARAGPTNPLLLAGALS